MPTSQGFSASIVRLLVTILAFKATRAGAVSLGLTAAQDLTRPKMGVSVLESCKQVAPPLRRQLKRFSV
jgi:hypothetical protein